MVVIAPCRRRAAFFRTARIAANILALGLCLGAATALADADEYAGMAWQPNSTVANPCGIGIPPRGNFPRDLWLNERRPLLSLTVKQSGSQLCYVANGIAEAPVIRARLGDALAITLRNEITDPGALAKLIPAGKLETANPTLADRAGFMPVIPGTRHAPTGRTNLHVHGFAVPPTAPQDEVMMGCADPATDAEPLCGQREITYRYQIPPTMPAGLYWYHPHVHGEVQAQMLAGLSGAIVIEGPQDEAREAAGIQDRVFIVRQEQDTDAGRNPAVAAAPDRGAPVTRVVPPRPRDPAIGGLRIDTSGELGCSDAAAIDEISLNGAPVVDGPARDQDLAQLEIANGTTQFWRVLNAATDAFLDLALIDGDGTVLPIRVVARDGAPIASDSGEVRDPVKTTDPQLVPPAGRVEFLVAAPPPGHKAYLVSHAVDTGCAGDRVPERTLALLKTIPNPDAASDTAADATEPAQPPARPVPSLFSGLLARKTDRERVIAFAEYPRPGTDDQTDFYIAERRPGAKLKPFDMSGPPIITVAAGSAEEWVMENWTNEIHAFHIHQLHFRVLAVNGERQADPPLLDTVTVPAALKDVEGAANAIAPGTVRIKLEFPAALAGDIPFHCHLVDHEDNGMMAVLRVTPPAGTAQKAQLPDLSVFGRSAICGPAGTADKAQSHGG
jgi:FtsP/CotA-like multicopper oxidase with cupredoxin domain